MPGASPRRRLEAAARLLGGRLASRRGPRRGWEAPTVGAGTDLPFDDERFEGRLVWIMGSPRTGTTWLLRMLIHPWILAASGPTGMRAPLRRGRRALPDVVPVDESYLMHHLTPKRPIRPPQAEDPSELLLNTARAADPAYFFSRAFAPAWMPELRRLVLVRLWSQATAAAREHSLFDPLVLIKEPNGSHGARELLSLLPRSRLLFVLRDGRDVVDSLLDARLSWAPSVRRLEGGGRDARLGFVREQSQNWVDWTRAVQGAYEAHPPERRLRVRYEDLRSATLPALRAVLDWLGLARSDTELRATVETNAFEALPKRMKGPGTPRRAARPGLWRETMSSEEQAAMMEIMGPTLAGLGYEAP